MAFYAASICSGWAVPGCVRLHNLVTADENSENKKAARLITTCMQCAVLGFHGNGQFNRQKMDALKRPLTIPPEFSRYAEEKGLFELYERMLSELLVAKPEDPLAFLHEYLSLSRDDGKHVITKHQWGTHLDGLSGFHYGFA